MMRGTPLRVESFRLSVWSRCMILALSKIKASDALIKFLSFFVHRAFLILRLAPHLMILVSWINAGLSSLGGLLLLEILPCAITSKVDQSLIDVHCMNLQIVIG